MKPGRYAFVLVVLSLALTGCRQGDGALPPQDGDIPNRIGDLGRDLASAAGGDKQAPQDTADDLAVFVKTGEPEKAARDLAVGTATALAGLKVKDETTQALANQLWLVVAGRQLSERQVEKLQADFKGTLASAGVPDQTAQSVSAKVPAVQKLVTSRTRRWYEFF